MAAIAAFSKSDSGRIYSAVCRVRGKDPGAVFEDDVLAFNFNAALLLVEQRRNAAATPDDTPTTDDPWQAAGAANEREWLGG